MPIGSATVNVTVTFAGAASLAGAGITPPAGDLGGSTSAPLVTGFNGIPLSGTPTAGQVWELNSGGTAFVPVTPTGGGSGQQLLVPTPVTASSVTAASWQLIIDNASSGTAQNVTTPASMPIAGTLIAYVRGSNTSNSMTLTANSGQTVAGLASLTTTSVQTAIQDQGIVIVSDGTSNWYVLEMWGADWGLGSSITGTTSLATTNVAGTLSANGGFQMGQTTTTATTLALANTGGTVQILNAASNAITVTLSFTATRIYVLKAENNGTNTVTITPASGTIEGASNFTMPVNGSILIGLVGADYKILGQYGSTVSTVSTVSTFTKPYWHRAKAQVRAGVRDRKLALLGDSIIYGYGSSLAGVGAAIHLANILGNNGIPSALGMSVPNIPSGLGTDARWGVGTGWTQGVDTGLGWGGANPSYSSTGAGAGTLFFIPGNDTLYDSFDIYYVNDPAYGSFQVGATGGSLTTITCSGTAGVGKTTITAGSASSINAVGFGTVTTGCTILGVEPWLSTQPKLRIATLGAEGTTAASWILPSSPTGFGPLNCITAYAPDVTIISLGTNDATFSTSVATFLSNLLTLASTCAATGDVFIMSSVPSNQSNTGAPNEIFYAAALPAFCATHGYGYIPLQESWGSAAAYALLNPLGYYFDTVHPTDTGYADYADFIAISLMKS
jgi:lysophospholipase L1-like esterase